MVLTIHLSICKFRGSFHPKQMMHNVTPEFVPQTLESGRTPLQYLPPVKDEPLRCKTTTNTAIPFYRT